MQEYDIKGIERIGFGSYGDVHKILFEGELSAVKIFKNETEYHKELNALKKLQHPNIIKLKKPCEWVDKYGRFKCIIMELATMGTLHHILYEHKYEYTFRHAINWLYQAADAINYLHYSVGQTPFIHRDLKPLNILMMSGGLVLKLCDFGTACDKRTLMTLEKGTPFWLAPEQMTNEKYDEKCDIYSYAVIMWEILTRRQPYFHLNMENKSFAVMYGVDKGTVRLKDISNCPKILDLIWQKGIQKKPELRPSMKTIFKVMQTLNSHINKAPLEQIVEQQRNSPPKFLEPPTIVTEEPNNDLETNNLDSFGRNKPDRLSFNVYSNMEELKATSDPNIKFHRRSKSYGGTINKTDLPNFKTSESNGLAEMSSNKLSEDEKMLLLQVATLEPLDVLYNNNESLKIFQTHRTSIEEYKRLEKEIANLKKTKEKLETELRLTESYNKLVHRRDLLREENQNLNSQFNLTKMHFY